jgi:hypothetical protein
MSQTQRRPAEVGKANNSTGQQSKSSSTKQTKKSQKAAAAFEAAVNTLARRLVRTSEVSSLAEAVAAVENVARPLTRALASCFKVEVHS